MTFIDVVLGTALMLIVFLGIAGAFRLSLEIVGSARAKTSALAILNERVEAIRSLPYTAVGTVGGIPSGTIAQTESISLNGVDFVVRTLIQYVDAPEDGLDDMDENGVTADYKKVKVEASWLFRGETRTFALSTTISPQGIEQLEGGGTLRVEVFDATAEPVQGASVRIVNDTVSPAVDVTALSNASGRVSFPGSPEGAGYEITVTKAGYSSAQTYDITSENPNPSPAHVAVVEGETSALSFAIDVAGIMRVYTYEPEEGGSFSDTFADTANLAELVNTETVAGALVLSGGPENYALSGSARSVGIVPNYLASWDEALWDVAIPEGTDARVQVFFDDAGTFTLVPESALPGNSAGFTVSPVDISALSTDTYGSLALGALLVTTDSAATPSLGSWGISYRVGPTPLPNVPFAIHGTTKTIGVATDGSPVYKFDQSFITTQYGEWFIDPMEWDTYVLSITSLYDIYELCPATLALAPGQEMAVVLTAVPEAGDTLRVVVSDTAGAPIVGATVALSGAGDAVSSACGQAFFDADEATYTVSVTKSGYQPSVMDVLVSGDTVHAVTLTP
jgi:hypothetical protein